MTKRIRTAIILLGIIVLIPAALITYRQFIVGTDCSKYDNTASWAWGGSGDEERQQCEKAGCEMVEARVHDDPNAFDDEYTDYRCLKRNATSPMTLEEFENREVIDPATWSDCDRVSKTEPIGCNLPRSMTAYELGQDTRPCANLVRYDYCIDRILSRGAKAPWNEWSRSYCEAVTDTKIAKDCQYYSGLYGNDISSCEGLDDSNPDKEHCFRVIAYKTGNREMCARLTHEPSRQSCELMCNPSVGCEIEDHYCAWSSNWNHHVCIPKDRSKCDELLSDQLKTMCQELCDPEVGCENAAEECVMRSVYGHYACGPKVSTQ